MLTDIHDKRRFLPFRIPFRFPWVPRNGELGDLYVLFALIESITYVFSAREDDPSPVVPAILSSVTELGRFI